MPKMRTGRPTISLILFIGFATGASPVAVGEDRFALWQPDGYWYPCTVLDEFFTTNVRYLLDGTEEELPRHDILIAHMGPGDVLWVQWPKDKLFYRARVLSRTGDDLRVRYDDGSEETATLARVRTKLMPKNVYEDDRVFARWQEDGYWYPAVVVLVQDGRYHVRYDDGTERALGRGEVMGYQVTASDPVQVNWRDGGKYYPARVLRRDHQKYRVRYSDNSESDAQRSQFRMDLDRIR
jgi:hypothetical protein